MDIMEISAVGGADSARGSGSGVASQVPDRAHCCFGVMSPNLALEAEQGDGVTKTDLFNLKKCGGLGDAATDSRHNGDFLPPKSAGQWTERSCGLTRGAVKR